MSKSNSRCSSHAKEESEVGAKSNTNPSIPTALRKIFFISQHMLQDVAEKLKLERFFHPGKGKLAMFITKENKQILEILEFSEPRRSWLINSEVCSNGHIYLTTPLDATFLALHHLRKHCQNRALALDSIRDDNDPSVGTILNNFVDPEHLKCIADVKTAGEDMTFYKYNQDKTMAWLSLKTKRIAKALVSNGIYCGNSAVSQNYTKSEKAVDETAQETDYLRVACDYVGDYIDLELHDKLTKHLKIPSEIQAITEEKKASKKRKSEDSLNSSMKKLKSNGAAAKLKSSTLLDVSLDDQDKDEEEENKVNISVKEETQVKSPSTVAATPLKERTLSAKEKSLAKSAKGTKNIASFFVKKTV